MMNITYSTISIFSGGGGKSLRSKKSWVKQTVQQFICHFMFVKMTNYVDEVVPYFLFRCCCFCCCCCCCGLVGSTGWTLTILARGLIVASLSSIESRKDLCVYLTRYLSSLLWSWLFLHIWHAISRVIVNSKNAPPATGAAA